ncbi:cytochrome b/b6 domain-containing protein [Marinospirillum sp.]|uniref:cytochrome b/b6 domain-containing protein n=1 Tax=Marinospirillum sp. TaxID=2183934 RepID=UPI00384E5E59
MKDQQDVQNIKVWDWSIRVFHWSLPLVIFALWFTRLDTEIHMLFAQLLMFLLLYRLIWGVIGTPYARFWHFVYGPRTLLDYTKGFFTGKKPLYVSHNPPGGWMVLVMLLALGLQLMTGLFIDDFIFPGPLYDRVPAAVSDWMTHWHPRIFNLLLVLIALHLLAIVVYRLKGEKLAKAMLTGKKQPSKQPRDLRAEPQVFPWSRFVLAVILALLPVGVVFYWL